MPRKRNVYATYIPSNGLTLPLEHIFSQYIDQPSFVNYDKEQDKQNIQYQLFGNLDAVSDNPTEDVYKATELIEATMQKQAFYILRKVGEITGQSEYVEAELKKVGKEINGDQFKDIIKSAKVYFGQDESTPKKEMSMEEINTVINESSLETVIGESDPKYVDIVKYNYFEREEYMTKYCNNLQSRILETLGYTKDELETKFFDCLNDDLQLDYDKFKKVRYEFLHEQLQKLDVKERTETNFLHESAKLDFALTSCTFNSQRKNFDPKKFFDYGSKKEYMNFALENIDPRASAKEMFDKFNYVFEGVTKNTDSDVKDLRLIEGVPYLNRLKEIHRQRPFFSRLVDYFRKDGEDSTIKKMEKQLKNIGYTKDQIKSVPEELSMGQSSYLRDTIENTYDFLPNRDFEPLPDVKEPVLDAFAQFDERNNAYERANEQMKENIDHDIAPEENVEIEEVNNDKSLQKNEDKIIE